MEKGKYILGGGVLLAWYLFASRHNGKPAIVNDTSNKVYPMKRYKVANEGWQDVDEKKTFKGGEVYNGIQKNDQIVTLYKNGKPYYDAVIEAMPGIPALIVTNDSVTFNGLGSIISNLI